MAKKFVVVATTVTAVAVAAGAIAARRRRESPAVIARSRPVPVTTAADNARRFGTEWHADDSYTQEYAPAADEAEAAAAR